MNFHGLKKTIRFYLTGAVSRRGRPCILLATLLMAVVASPMTVIVLQMQGPAVVASIFDTESESESEEDSSTDATDVGDFLTRPRERNRRQDLRLIRPSNADRGTQAHAGMSLGASQVVVRELCVLRLTPLRC